MFLINWGEITSRWDPIYISYLRQTRLDFNFPTKPLKNVTNSFSGGTPSKDIAEYWNGSIPWASPKDIKEFYLSCTEDYITEEGLSNSSSKIADRGAVLLVVRSGILQHTIPVSVCVVPMAINQDIKVLIPNNNLLPEFLGYYFIVFNEKVLPRIVKYSTTVQSINTFELEKLPIPLPSLVVQQKIISIMNEAYEQKKKKVKEADELLKSINDYILDVLGICLPTKEQGGLNDRIFYIKSNDVLGQRLDPAYHMKKYVDFIHSVELGKYQTKKLNHFIKQITYGASVDNHYAEEGIPLLRIKDLCPNEIIGDDIVYLPRSFENKVASSRVNEGDILISRSGTIGVCSVVNRQFDGYAFGSFMIKVSVENIEPKYVSYILNSPIGAIFFERNRIGAIQGNITIPVIQSVPIPVPNSSVQRELIEHIDSIRDRVNHLKNEAENTVENAKIEVERILLGDK